VIAPFGVALASVIDNECCRSVADQFNKLDGEDIDWGLSSWIGTFEKIDDAG
jgi:hypothetical protein